MDALNEPEVVAALNILEEANKAYGTVKGFAEDRLAGSLVEQLGIVNRRIASLAQERKQGEPPVHIQDLLRRCRRGMDYGSKPFLVRWVSPTGRFFIVTVQGHSTWAGRGTMRYAPSTHYLMDCAGEGRDAGNHGHDIWRAIEVKGCELDGRLSRDQKGKWIRQAIDTEQREPNAWIVTKSSRGEAGT